MLRRATRGKNGLEPPSAVSTRKKRLRGVHRTVADAAVAATGVAHAAVGICAYARGERPKVSNG